MDKECFLKRLKEMSPKEINEWIEQKGKKPKLFNPFIRIK